MLLWGTGFTSKCKERTFSKHFEEEQYDVYLGWIILQVIYNN